MEEESIHPNIVECRLGDLPADIILGVTASSSQQLESSVSNHTNIFATRSYAPFVCSDVGILTERLADCAYVFRTKGFVWNNEGVIYNVQVVGSRFESTEWSDDIESGIVVIGLAERFDEVDALIESCRLGEP